MTEHRVTLEPSVISRLGNTMQEFSDAWQADVDDLRAAKGQVELLNRELKAATDRCDGVISDLRSERERNEALVRRNAFLEAQLQTQYETTLDARDALSKVADRAAETARAAPDAEPKGVRMDGTISVRATEPTASIPRIPKDVRAAPRTLADVRREQAEDHDEPQEKPLFLRTPLPDVEFARAR